MTRGRRKTFLGLAAAVVAAALAIGLAVAFGSTGGKPPAHKLAAAAPSPSPPQPKPKPRPTACRTQQRVSPFTGEPIKSLGHILAVKIDNIVYARPQTGLTKADIVYVLPVEGGLTRFLAIFSSHIPPVVGPVRSARQDDLPLLRQFGTPAFAWSGATPWLVPVVKRARIVDLYADIASGYFRNYSRIAPYNLYADTHVLLSEAKGRESRAHCIGFLFGSTPAGGRRTRSVSVRYPAASYKFTWSPRRKRWLVWMDGARAASTEGPQLSAATVVIQHTDVKTSPFREENRRPPYAMSTGRGWALVLRNGRAYRVRWSRPHPRDGTTFTTYSGKPFTFQKGPLWILFVGNWRNESG